MPKVSEVIELLREAALKLEMECDHETEVEWVLCPDGGYSGDPEPFAHTMDVHEEIGVVYIDMYY